MKLIGGLEIDACSFHMRYSGIGYKRPFCLVKGIGFLLIDAHSTSKRRPLFCLIEVIGVL